MFNTPTYILKLLAAIVWYCGAVILYLKSASLLLEASTIQFNSFWIILTVLTGLIIGAIKAHYLFKPICINNIKRINNLKCPKIWNFYRQRFFIFLFCMISLGIFLSHVAHDNYLMLLIVALIDITIATALLGSSWIFWRSDYR